MSVDKKCNKNFARNLNNWKCEYKKKAAHLLTENMKK